MAELHLTERKVWMEYGNVKRLGERMSSRNKYSLNAVLFNGIYMLDEYKTHTEARKEET